MQAAVISIVAGPIVNELLGNVSKWIRDEYSGFTSVTQDLEKLASTLTTIQDVLQDAEEKQQTNRGLRNWLGKLLDVALDGQDVLELYATKAIQWKKKPQVTNMLYKFNTAHKIKKLMERVEGIAEEKSQFDLTASLYHCLPDAQQHNHQQTTHHVVESSIVGRKADREDIINMLQSDENSHISVIPITGMGGLGKTTLAQLVYKDDRVGEGQFKPRMWASVGPKFDLKRIIIEMIQSHSEAKDSSLINLSFSNLKDRLLYILDGNRFLLVLDNVWTYDVEGWGGLKNLLIDGGGNGSKILITSRNLTVCQKMGTELPHQLACLPSDESFALFKRNAFVDHLTPLMSEDERQVLEGIGEQIVGKCKGLPLAITALGSLLRGNTAVSKWNGILLSEIWEIEGDGSEIDHENKILPALKLSYDHLPSILKQCFAYCSIFPKSHVFIKEGLVKLWMAQGFVQQRRQQRTEETGMEYFDRLFERSFFQPSQDGTYGMHDLIHDLAVSISSPLHCQVKDPNSLPAKTSRHVSILCEDVEKHVGNIARGSKKLRTLLLPNSNLGNSSQVLDMIFHQLPYVRALDLSSSSVSELPKSVEELKLLRYLNLSNTEIKTLPNSVCNLYHLETLKLLGCVWLTELPNNLGKLCNLRHLELDEMFWFKSSGLPPRMGNLTSLNNLHAFWVGRDSGYQLQELQNMANLTGELRIVELENAVNSGEAALDEKKSLDELRFEWSANRQVHPQDEASEEVILTELKPHSNIKVLKICHYRGTAFPLWMGNELLRNLVTLTLKGCTNCRNLSLGKLPRLRQLYIRGMQALEKWMETEAMQYGALDTLKISDCPVLMELPEMFPSLRVMKVKKCHSLKALPLTPSLQFLMLLDNLVLENWNEDLLPYGITRDEQGQTISCLLPSFLRLLELKVIRCPKLQDLPEIFAPQKLEISQCELISVLPDPQNAQRLQHMALDSCHDGMLARKIPDTNSIYSLVLSNISSLASPPKWPHLPGLKALYIIGCADLVSLSDKESPLHTLTSLVLLSVRDCPKLVTLVEEGLPATLECLIIGSCSSLTTLGPKETLQNLTSLKDLYIEDCPLFQSLPKDNLPTSLKHLHIHECPLLRKQWDMKNGGDPKRVANSHIPDMDIHFKQVTSLIASGRQMAPPAAWYHPLICCKAMDLEGDKDPAQPSI